MSAAEVVAAPRPEALTVALAGRQNAGKTSILMHLTGSIQKPVNFPGSSVERSEAHTQWEDVALRLVDLPGIASLHTVSPDERIAVDYLRGEADEPPPDVVCVVVDAGKLTVELRLVDELRALGPPLVVALTKNDVCRVEGRPVDVAGLQAAIGVPVIEVNALSGAGTHALEEAFVDASVGGPQDSRAIDPDAIARSVQPADDDQGPSLTDRIDAVVLHPVFGLPLLGLVVYGIFQLIFTGADPFIGAIESGQQALADVVLGLLGPGALRSFVVDGLINGVGSIVVFLPQIVMLIALVAVLEATGYMARAAFLLDRVLSKVGLSGRSFVPMASSFACAVPGILAARIIDDERDRLATIVTAPLMSCSARLPVYVVLIGAFFPVAWAGLVLFGMYALGIITAALVAWSLRKSVLKGPRSVLMMELPVYQRPSLRVVMGQVRVASREFMVLAGTVIFATSIVIWFFSYYPRPAGIHEDFEAQRQEVAAAVQDEQVREQRLAKLEAGERAAYLEQSWLARAGKAIQPVVEPAGFDWRTTVGILAAFPARELIVPTLGILYSAGEVDPGAYDVASLDVAAPKEDGLRANLREAMGSDGKRSFNPLVALSLMVFFALCSQCMSTLATIRRETRSWRWPVFTFVYMTVLAWLAAVAVYQMGSALGFGSA
ncbi:MAG: ferrous iron transport protein B [Myxococcota bacterium]